MIISGACFLWLLIGIKFKYILYFSIVMMALNFAYEFWSPILNTIDPLDAYYGFAGGIVALLEMFIIWKWGLKKIEIDPLAEKH